MTDENKAQRTNRISENAFKALLALNSGAFFALIHFWVKEGGSEALNNLPLHPAYLFSLGLTSLILFMICEYLRSVWSKFDSFYTFCLSFVLAILAAFSFVFGCWFIARALVNG